MPQLFLFFIRWPSNLRLSTVISGMLPMFVALVLAYFTMPVVFWGVFLFFGCLNAPKLVSINANYSEQLIILTLQRAEKRSCTAVHNPDETHTIISSYFIIKTRRVAVYLETHCNIGSKRAFPTGVLDRWHNCLLIYWCTTYLVTAYDDT